MESKFWALPGIEQGTFFTRVKDLNYTVPRCFSKLKNKLVSHQFFLIIGWSVQNELFSKQVSFNMNGKANSPIDFFL